MSRSARQVWNDMATVTVAQSVAAFQPDAQRRYAKDESAQQSLARIHTRLDEAATKEDVRELRDDLREDIKTLIAMSGA